MTKKLEELLNLPPSADFVEEGMTTAEQEVVIEATETLVNSISMMEKIDHALSTVDNLTDHDKDMDEISQKALKSYDDLCTLGLNVADGHTARLFEVAATMLRTAMDAKEAKVNRKLRTLDLQLKRAKMEKEGLSKEPDEGTGNNGQEFDRNELLAYFKQRVSESNSEESDK